MKRYLLLLSMFLTLSASYVHAADKVGTKFMSVELNPLGAALSLIDNFWYLSGGVNFKVADQLALGVGGQHLAFTLPEVLYRETGAILNLTYNFSGPMFTDSWYIRPSVGYAGINVTNPNSGASATFGAMSTALTAGYHWV